VRATERAPTLAGLIQVVRCAIGPLGRWFGRQASTGGRCYVRGGMCTRDAQPMYGAAELVEPSLVGGGDTPEIAGVKIPFVGAAATSDPLEQVLRFEVEEDDNIRCRKRPARAVVDGMEECVVCAGEVEVGEDQILDWREVEHDRFCEVAVLVVVDEQEAELGLKRVALNVGVEVVKKRHVRRALVRVGNAGELGEELGGRGLARSWEAFRPRRSSLPQNGLDDSASPAALDANGASADSAVALSRRLGVSDALIGKVRRGELYKSPDSRRSAVATDRPGWALAFYTGMRRGEIGRAQWQHVFWDADEIMVAASKSDAGEGRRVPMVGPLKRILGEEWMRLGRPAKGAIVVRSVDSGKWQARADREWEAARLARVTLHEARHTYASFLMAAATT
jgi:hypothetical protein